MPVELCPAAGLDAPFLTEMLVLAVGRPERPSGSVEQVLSQPQLAHYVAGWPRPGDLGVISSDRPRSVGAARLRLFPAGDPGYGFVDADTPELAMGVLPERRGRGVGTRLLDALIDAAHQHGLPAISPSVNRDNPARRLYRRAGFRQVDQTDDAFNMVPRL